ncbi:MAG: protein-L-isoaspartate O-methyltransferase [Maricaulaceae bacterium]|nr:protein-L-isoaspartate O-methyltransferase [Maricaulaceae bacterium]
MSDFAAERRRMLDGQIHTADVTDRRLLAAFGATPRERFIPRARAALAYADTEVETAAGRWLMRPRDMAKLIHAAAVQADEVVLDLACGRGYSTAVLSRMAETVVGLESDPELAARAGKLLAETGCDNAVVIEGDLKAGAPSHGPFDVIFVNGAVEEVPHAWLEQLAMGGRLAVVVRKGAAGRALVYTRSAAGFGSRPVFDAAPPVLPGFARAPGFAF